MSVDSEIEVNNTELDKRFKNYDKTLYFTLVSQKLARDERLSWKARGLYLYMASNNHSWKFHPSELSSHSDKDGRVATRSALNELCQYGYLKRVQPHKHGRFGHVEYVMYYVPNDYYEQCVNTANRLPAYSNTASGQHTTNKQQVITNNKSQQTRPLAKARSASGSILKNKDRDGNMNNSGQQANDTVNEINGVAEYMNLTDNQQGIYDALKKWFIISNKDSIKLSRKLSHYSPFKVNDALTNTINEAKKHKYIKRHPEKITLKYIHQH